MVKKLIAISGALFVLTTYAFAALLTSPTTKVYSGAKDVSVEVTVDTQADSLSAFNATMQYDSTKLTFKQFSTDSIPNKQLQYNQTGPGEVKFIVFGMNNYPISNGKAFDVVFDVIEENASQISVLFVDTAGATPDAQSVQVTIDPLVFNVVLKGDINSDGFVNSADVTLLFQGIIGLKDIPFGEADLNSDGKLTASDLQELVNIIIG